MTRDSSQDTAQDTAQNTAQNTSRDTSQDTSRDTYAGRSHDERVAERNGAAVPAQEQPGGDLAKPGTGPGPGASSGELSDKGKKVWREGNTIGGEPTHDQ